MTNTVNKRLERKDFNGPVILCDHAIQFLIECWRHDGGNLEVLAEIFPIHDRVVTGKTAKAKAIVGKVWVTTGSPEDLQELNKLRQENVSIKQENKRLRITEKLWLESEEKKRETARRISKATRGKKKRQ